MAGGESGLALRDQDDRVGLVLYNEAMKNDPLAFNPEAFAQMQRIGRNFSSSRELIELADAMRPRFRFHATSRTEWRSWRRGLLRGLRKALGPRLESVPLRAEVIERVDCGHYVREKVVYDTTPRMSVPAYVLIPKEALRSRCRVPAVLAIHGHGRGACDLVGLSPGNPKDNAHRDYALDVVNRGMVALAPELRGFGQRAVEKDQLKEIIVRIGEPGAKSFRRDMCSVQNLKANLLGYTFMGMQLHDLRCALDYLCTRPEVNRARLGACGLSTGGMMTLFLAATDRRVRCAVISGTLTSYRSYAFRIETTCGSQLPHGLLRYGDLADVACLIAPRPVCFENGSDDFGFLQEVAAAEFVRIRKCYELLGVAERAVFDAFDGGHVWNGAVGLPMMEAWLKR